MTEQQFEALYGLTATEVSEIRRISKCSKLNV